jgi:hypothetical protein
MINLKDRITTIAGIVGAICTGLLAVPGMPEVIQTVAGALLAISIAIIGYFNGKTADGKVKSLEQLVK